MASPNAVRVTRTLAYSSCIAKTFQQLRLDDEITDFTIVSGKQSFNCHRVILAGSSPVLRAMVRSSMTEASENKANINIFSSAVIQLILDYIYTGDVVIPHEHLQKAIEAADYLQLLELKEICIGDASSTLQTSNIVSWYKLAVKLDIEELKFKCVEIMSSSLAEVSRFAEFQDLSFTEVNSFMSSMKETDADHDDVLEASMEWINAKPIERVNYMEELLQKIQLSECSVECLENEMETHEDLFMRFPAGYRLINKALLKLMKETGVRQKWSVKEKSQPMVVVIGGQRGYNYVNKVCWKLNACLQLEELCKIPSHSMRFGACKIPDGFVLTGGVDNTLCSMYLLSTNTWKQLKDMKSARCNHGSIFTNGKIFVFGGGNRTMSKSASVHSLALDGNSWTEETELPIEVHRPEVATTENNIFLLDITTNHLLHLDMNTRTWSCRQGPSLLCGGARMVVVSGQLLVAGGCHRIAAQYDYETNTWCSLKSPTLSHNYGALASLNKTWYLIGGSDEDRVEEYNTDTKVWSVCDMRMPNKFLDLRALVLDI